VAAALTLAVPLAIAVPASEPTPPTLLPGDARVALIGSAKPGSWLVGARSGPDAERIARRFEARLLMPTTGIYRVAADRARGFARALRTHDSYQYSEPDSYLSRQSFPSDPLTPYQWGLPAMGASSLTPPPVTAESPLLAIVEDGIDVSHPDAQGAAISGPAGGSGDPAGIFHGTSVTSVASAPANGAGITGVWPGARTLLASTGPSCGSIVNALYRAADAGAKVINMSYGFPAGACFSHWVATQRLYGYGVVLVAASGNDFQEGNPAGSIPATSPHVITVAALNPNLSSAGFLKP
jgi:hypothetical protein